MGDVKRVFVSGPYSSDPEAHTRRAIEAGNDLLDAGFAPLVPHLSHLWHSWTPREYEEWMRIDLAWVAVADAVLRLSGDSPGADRECAAAVAAGVPVYHDLAALIAKMGGE